MWYGWTGNVLRLDLSKPLVTIEDGKNALEVALEILGIIKSQWK